MGDSVNAILAPRTVRRPADLAVLLREIKAAVAAGSLRQVRPDPSLFATDMNIGEIAEDGPWPDYLEMRFDIPGSPVRYKLAVETYHGASGTWGPE